jgi:flagellar biosynthetic protein FliR
MYEFLEQNILLYTLVLFRMTGFFAVAPFFGRNNFPVYGKVILALFCSAIIAPMIEIPNIEPDWFSAFLLAAKETIIGTALGFIGLMIFSAVYLAGQMIDMQIGFGMVNVLDPQNNIQVPIMGNFLYIIVFLTFLITNSHHYMIIAFIQSYDVISITQTLNLSLSAGSFTVMFARMFIIAFKIATPVICTVFLTDVALGIIARTVPQVNVFLVGLPIKIIAGMFVIAAIIPVYLIIMDIIFNEVLEGMALWLEAVAK